MLSQALEVAIGLALVFFVLSLTASMIVESISRVLSRRAEDLNNAIKTMLKDPDNFYETSIYEAMIGSTGSRFFGKDKTRRPSYIPASAFADGVVEVMHKWKATHREQPLHHGLAAGPVRDRVEAIVAEFGEDLTQIRVGLESWFDATMGRLEGLYKRWAAVRLFFVGLFVAVVANVSTYEVGTTLWVDPAVRATVVAAAEQVAASEDPSKEIEGLEGAIADLESFELPIGWGPEMRTIWSTGDLGSIVATLLGWLTTALLIMLGSTFWFDLLARLVSLRAAGDKPKTADRDPASATALKMAAAGRSGGGPAGS